MIALREVTVTTPPSRPPRTWNGEGEVLESRASVVHPGAGVRRVCALQEVVELVFFLLIVAG